MYKFEVHQVGKNKRITLFHTGGKCSEFCSVYVARPDEFAEIPKIKAQWSNTIATRLSAMEFEDVDFDDVEARLLAAEAAETAAVAAIPKENDCGGACTI